MSMQVAVTKPQQGELAREEFGSRSLSRSAETTQSAMVAQATASVQARYIMALQRPRSWDDVRVRLLRECDRTGFARVARYLKPVGKGFRGPSIRFAEAALRYAGNMGVEAPTILDDASKRIIHVVATDYETNASFAHDITLDKTVERQKLREGQISRGSRLNSEGKLVHLVDATEDELHSKEGGLVSKIARNLILRLIPGDITDECMDRCIATMSRDVQQDPDGERKKVCDAFAAIGVKPSDLVAYLGHALEGCSPAELVDLRGMYSAIRDGQATWSDYVAEKEKPAPAEPDSAKRTTKLADKLKAQRSPDASEEVAKGATTPAPPPVDDGLPFK